MHDLFPYLSLIAGLKTGLVEKFDFSSGTSSRSTKLIHGGVRYLQKAIFNFDIEQVGLGVCERERDHHLFCNRGDTHGSAMVEIHMGTIFSSCFFN